MRHFGIGVSAPGYDRPIDFLPKKLKWHQDISNYHARGVIGGVRELESVRDVACRVNVRLRGLEIIIHLYSVRSVFHTRRFEIQRLHHRATVDRQEQRLTSKLNR